MEFLCRSGNKILNQYKPKIEFECKKTQICFNHYNSLYPKTFRCAIGEYISVVNASYYGKFTLEYLNSFYKLLSFLSGLK